MSIETSECCRAEQKGVNTFQTTGKKLFGHPWRNKITRLLSYPMRQSPSKGSHLNSTKSGFKVEPNA